jgi:hypothetical protein
MLKASRAMVPHFVPGVFIFSTNVRVLVVGDDAV